MVIYTLFLHITKSNQTYEYSVNLSQDQENEPEKLRDPTFSKALGQNLQQQSQCAVDEASLNFILTGWIQDIKEGYRKTSLSLAELPPLAFSCMTEITDQGNQELPELFDPQIPKIPPHLGVLPPLNFT